MIIRSGGMYAARSNRVSDCFITDLPPGRTEGPTGKSARGFRRGDTSPLRLLFSFAE